MLSLVPNDYIAELISYHDTHKLSQSCKTIQFIFVNKYNQLLKENYKILVRDNVLNNPYKTYKMLDKLYNGKFL